jgi:endonuclease/exonuclease/phosphatase family metal-dependent hydrolase
MRLKPVKKLLDKFYPYHKYASNNGAVMGCLSKYPILSSRLIDYVSRSNCSYAYEIKVNEDTVLVVNNHFESYKLSRADKALYKDVLTSPQSAKDNSGLKKLLRRMMRSNKTRGAQVDSVKAFLDANAPNYRHVIVCGDFNETPVSYSHNQLTENLNDAFASSGNGLGFSYRRNGMFFRLDHILVSDAVKVHDAYVDYSTDASDHYPMCASVELK